MLGVGRAVGTVLADPMYREHALRLRDAMAALPGPQHGNAVLERLAREKTPQMAASS